MNPKAKITKKEKIGKTPKKEDLFADADPLLSPFNEVKLKSYLTKNGEWKSFVEIREKNHFKEENKLQQNQGKTDIKKVTFEPKLCRFTCKGKEYTPQRNGGRCEILKELWKSRSIVNLKNEIKREGSFKTIDELAVAGRFIKNIMDFNERKGTADRSVRDAIQDLRSKFNKMGAPIKILAQNGYMLVVEE